MQVNAAHTPGECSYVEAGHACRLPAAGELRAHVMDHGPWPMCARHLRPEYHPPNLHDKLVPWC